MRVNSLFETLQTESILLRYGCKLPLPAFVGTHSNSFLEYLIYILSF